MLNIKLVIKMSDISTKIEQISARMAMFCTVLIVIIPALLIWSWLDFEGAQRLGLFHRIAQPLTPPSTASLVGGFLISAVLGAFVIGAIYHLRHFFRLCTSGEIFSGEGAESLHKFSKYIVCYAFLAIPAETLIGFVMNINNPVGERIISLSFQTYDLTVIFLCLVVFAISWIYRESVLVAEENAQIV